MLDDQRYWVEQFIKVCKEDTPDAIVIAGDVYDRAAPSGDAVELLDYMLTQLAEMDIPVMLIAGNHDSGQRLSFGRSLLAKQKIQTITILIFQTRLILRKARTFKITLKTSNNKVLKSKYVYLTINKKTYKVKTNSKGVAAFKIKLPKVKKTYKYKVKFKGDNGNYAKTYSAKLKVY
jgi:exonuclease SbcD